MTKSPYKLADRATDRLSHQLQHRGIIRPLRANSSTAEGSTVTVWFQTWPHVPAWAVGYFADRYFTMLYPKRATDHYRKSIESGHVTVLGHRPWTIRYAPATNTNTFAEAFGTFR